MNTTQAEATIARFGLKAARLASRRFAEEHGYSWSEKSRLGGSIIEHLPATEVYDTVRDAAYDLLTEADLDPDEWLLDVTDEGTAILL